MSKTDALTEDQEVEIRGDLLETVLSHVPAVDLVAASQVSIAWSDAVSSSLRHHNPPMPWLILHVQSTRCPRHITARAYDPRSDVWIRMTSKPSIPHAGCALRSSHSNFLYMLSPSEFSFSLDPLGCDWRAVDPPLVCRTDPIVARVGDCVVVAGGACDFEDDPFAVEIYCLETGAWRRGDSMPRSTATTSSSLSFATVAGKLVVADKQSGESRWFDPDSGTWSGPAVLDPGESVTSYHIGSVDGRLILIGVCKIENVERLKIWGFGGNDDFRVREEIGEMEEEFVSRLKGESFGGDLSVDVRVAGNVVYVYSAWAAEVVVACEVIRGGACRWWSVRSVVTRDEMIGKRLVVSCAEVGVEELRRAMVAKGWRFER